jgi:hypothetical protein
MVNIPYQNDKIKIYHATSNAATKTVIFVQKEKSNVVPILLSAYENYDSLYAYKISHDTLFLTIRNIQKAPKDTFCVLK